MNTQLINREFNSQVIKQGIADGYINATAMCQATDKKWNDYWRLDNTQTFLSELSNHLAIPVGGNSRNGTKSTTYDISENRVLIVARQGGFPELQGTWIHPWVAIHLAQWCSPEFAVAVTGWVFELLTTGTVGMGRIQQQIDKLEQQVKLLQRSVRLEYEVAGPNHKLVPKPTVKQNDLDTNELLEKTQAYLVGKDRVTVSEAVSCVFGGGRPSRVEQTRIGIIVKHLGWCKRRDPKPPRKYYYTRS
jgi:hypothetical protein